MNPGARFCVNCGQKVEQEQNPQAEAVATTVARVFVAGAASSADISYKKSINDSPKQEGFVAANAQENVHTDANADTNGNSNPKVNPDEFKHTNTAGEVNTDAYSAQAAPKQARSFEPWRGPGPAVQGQQCGQGGCFQGAVLYVCRTLNRKSYIYRSIFLSLVLGIIQGILELATVAIEALELLFAVLLLALCIFGFVAGIMMLARRLHDLDKSGWWMLLLFVPLVNILFYIYILFFKGTEGPNQYGEDPLQQ